LLALRSDAYVVTSDQRLELAAEREGVPPEVVLDGRHYKLLAGLEPAFADGPPSLLRCTRLEIRGPWTFGAGVVCEGDVSFCNDGSAPAEAAGGAYRNTCITA
jgi:hypothetical protein